MPLAKKFPEAEVTGITISPEQQARATALAAERGASAGLIDPFEVVLPIAGSDPAFTTWWPLVVDRQNDCRAEIG